MISTSREMTAAVTAGLAALLWLPASALAADADVEAIAAPFDWSGVYVGAVAGAGLFDTTFTDAVESISFGSLDISDWGWAAGVTAGANWQSGSMVLGLEADFNWSDLEIEELHHPFGVNAPTRHDRSWDWFATLRARAGLALENSLIYVTGGIALVSVDFKADYDPPNECGAYYGYCFDERVIGLTLGAGAEYGIGEHASVKIEGLWVGLPTESADDVFSGDDENYHVSSSAALGRIGLNWRF